MTVPRLDASCAGAVSVPRLDAFLTGRWTVERTVEDPALGAGTFAGEAEFTPDGDGLIWRERGRLRLGAYDGPAARTLRIEPDGGGWLVRFADGRPFHAVDLRDGACAVAHPCGEDRYEGEYRVTGLDALRVRWRVRGPAKDGRIASRYRRV
jgi:Family of unknown function (DUF6314)